MKSPADIAAGAKIARVFADGAVAAMRDGNTPLAIANYYWWKRYAARTLNVLDASRLAIASMKNGSAMIPPGALVVLPAFDEAALASGSLSLDLSQGIPVSGGTMDLFKEIAKGVSGTSLPPMPEYNFSLDSRGLPLNTPVRLQNDVVVERRTSSLVIYNEKPVPQEVSLARLQYLPPVASPPAELIRLAPLVSRINRARLMGYYDCRSVYRERARQGRNPEWVSYADYCRPMMGYGGTHNKVEYWPMHASVPIDGKPFWHKVGAVDVAGDPIPWLVGDRTGASSRLNPRYLAAVREASNLQGSLYRAISFVQRETSPDGPFREKFARDFSQKCVSRGMGFHVELLGVQFMRLVCDAADTDAPVYTEDYYIDAMGAYRTWSSLLADKEIVAAMHRRVAVSQDVANAVSLVPGLGEIENARQCLGYDTWSSIALRGGTKNLLRGWLPEGWLDLNNDLARAQMAGWKSVQEASAVDTAINCVGAIPLAAKVGKAVEWGTKGTKWAAAKLGQTLSADAALFRKMYDVFDVPIAPGEFVRQTEAIMQIFPNNADLAAFVKTVYTTMQNGLDVGATAQGANALYNYDYKLRRGKAEGFAQ